MNNVSGAALGLKAAVSDEYDARTWIRWAMHNYIFVDERAHRFMDEDVLYTEMLRHGKQYRRGCFTESALPTGCWAIFGDEEFNSGSCIFSTSSFASMKAVEGRFTTNQEGSGRRRHREVRHRRRPRCRYRPRCHGTRCCHRGVQHDG